MISMSSETKAVDIFQEGFNCSQAVLTNYAPALGLERETALKLASAFGGGMAQMGETCGAVTGAFMVIGLRYGRFTADDLAAKEKTYALVKEFVTRFSAKHGSIMCRDILGYDLSTEEGRALVKEKELTRTLCPEFVQDAVNILDEIL